jgi:hypothetical protein
MSLAFFRVLKGHFHVCGFKPDGDSVRFAANNPALFQGLHREHLSRSPTGEYQLRLEGIDAPETHFGVESQPHGDASRDRLLSLLGVAVLERAEQKILRSNPERVPGAILTKGFDPHGRPISYALLGDAPDLVEGSEIEVPLELLARTINAQMVVEGFAYPLLYTSTPAIHREWLRQQALAARAQQLGVWAVDSSTMFRFVDRTSVCHPGGALIYPKFFRRCVEYLRQRTLGEVHVDFTEWLAAAQRENDLVVVNKLEIPLSQMFRRANAKIVCQADVLDMVFVEK